MIKIFTIQIHPEHFLNVLKINSNTLLIKKKSFHILCYLKYLDSSFF